MRKSEHEALAAHVDAHTHAGLLGGSGSVAGLTSPPTTSPTGLPVDTSPAITGTPVLKA